ncbi:MAG: hypothetical protein K1X57_18455 [Gemmataceae bacterium]|nr:hypothetical protein [Gemmataceae bacterium]
MQTCCNPKVIGVLLVAVMASAVQAADPAPAVVVVLKPGESKSVSVVWDDVGISRAASLWVTPKARVTEHKEVDRGQEFTANGVVLSVDKKETERIQAVLTPSERKGSFMTVAAVLKVTAESGARPGVTKLYARWGGGQGAVDLRAVEIRVLVEDK